MTDVMKKMALQIGDLEQRLDRGSTHSKGIQEPGNGGGADDDLFDE